LCTADFSVFVGDLAADVTDYVLQETFRQFFPSVRSAKVGAAVGVCLSW
jgi:RNA recognition motif-containing protein